MEADVATLRQIAMRLKVALQDGSGFHMRRLSPLQLQLAVLTCKRLLRRVQRFVK